jgi:hypothetical protein
MEPSDARELYEYLVRTGTVIDIDSFASQIEKLYGIDKNKVKDELETYTTNISKYINDYGGDKSINPKEYDPSAVVNISGLFDKHEQNKKMLIDDSYQILIKDSEPDTTDISDDEKTTYNILKENMLVQDLKDEEGNVTKFGRNLGKPPQMTSMYGAGLKKISLNIAYTTFGDLAQNILKKDENGDYVYAKILEHFYDILENTKRTNKSNSVSSEAKVMNMARLLTEKDFDEIKVTYVDTRGKVKKVTLEDYLVEINRKIFGKPITENLDKKFWRVFDKNRAISEAALSMFKIFETKLKEMLNDELMKLDYKDRFVTKEMITNILNSEEMSNYIPGMDFPIVTGNGENTRIRTGTNDSSLVILNQEQQPSKEKQ